MFWCWREINVHRVTENTRLVKQSLGTEGICDDTQQELWHWTSRNILNQGLSSSPGIFWYYSNKSHFIQKEKCTGGKTGHPVEQNKLPC